MNRGVVQIWEDLHILLVFRIIHMHQTKQQRPYKLLFFADQLLIGAELPMP